MSRLTELKKQFPELNISIIDILRRMDPTDSYKYLPLLCKIFSERFKHGRSRRELQEVLNGHKFFLDSRGVNTENTVLKEIIAISELSTIFSEENFQISKEFIELSEKNFLENKDITSYSGLDDMREAISLASLKEISKVLQNEVHKEYEDEKWVCVRPLSFASSQKYGATTKWCTTYEREKQYFEKYWRRGILVYFINKKTGYKFAGFKALDDNEGVSFWNQIDQRVDYLDLEIDDYMFPVCRKIFSSKDTNKNLCSAEIQEQVHIECLDIKEGQEPESYPVNEAAIVPIRQLWVEDPTMTPQPSYEQPNIA